MNHGFHWSIWLIVFHQPSCFGGSLENDWRCRVIIGIWMKFGIIIWDTITGIIIGRVFMIGSYFVLALIGWNHHSWHLFHEIIIVCRLISMTRGWRNLFFGSWKVQSHENPWMNTATYQKKLAKQNLTKKIGRKTKSTVETSATQQL